MDEAKSSAEKTESLVLAEKNNTNENDTVESPTEIIRNDSNSPHPPTSAGKCDLTNLRNEMIEPRPPSVDRIKLVENESSSTINESEAKSSSITSCSESLMKQSIGEQDVEESLSNSAVNGEAVGKCDNTEMMTKVSSPQRQAKDSITNESSLPEAGNLRCVESNMTEFKGGGIRDPPSEMQKDSTLLTTSIENVDNFMSTDSDKKRQDSLASDNVKIKAKISSSLIDINYTDKIVETKIIDKESTHSGETVPIRTDLTQSVKPISPGCCDIKIDIKSRLKRPQLLADFKPKLTSVSPELEPEIESESFEDDVVMIERIESKPLFTRTISSEASSLNNDSKYLSLNLSSSTYINKRSSLYVNNPDFSKRAQTALQSQPQYYKRETQQQMQDLSSSDLSPLRMKPPDFSKVAHQSVPSVNKMHPTNYVTPSNFEEISKKYNYISDLQLKPQSTVRSSQESNKVSPSSFSLNVSSNTSNNNSLRNLYINAPDFTSQKFQSPENQREIITPDEPRAHVIHKNIGAIKHSPHAQQFSSNMCDISSKDSPKFLDPATRLPPDTIVRSYSSIPVPKENIQQQFSHPISSAAPVSSSNYKYEEQLVDQRKNLYDYRLQNPSHLATNKHNFGYPPSHDLLLSSTKESKLVHHSTDKTYAANLSSTEIKPTVIQNRLSTSESRVPNYDAQSPAISLKQSENSVYTQSRHIQSPSQGSVGHSMSNNGYPLTVYSKQPTQNPAMMTGHPHKGPGKIQFHHQQAVSPSMLHQQHGKSVENNQSSGLMNPPQNWPVSTSMSQPTNRVGTPQSPHNIPSPNFVQPSPRPTPSPTHLSRSVSQSPVSYKPSASPQDYYNFPPQNTRDATPQQSGAIANYNYYESQFGGKYISNIEGQSKDVRDHFFSQHRAVADAKSMQYVDLTKTLKQEPEKYASTGDVSCCSPLVSEAAIKYNSTEANLHKRNELSHRLTPTETYGMTHSVSDSSLQYVRPVAGDGPPAKRHDCQSNLPYHQSSSVNKPLNETSGYPTKYYSNQDITYHTSSHTSNNNNSYHPPQKSSSLHAYNTTVVKTGIPHPPTKYSNDFYKHQQRTSNTNRITEVASLRSKASSEGKLNDRFKYSNEIPVKTNGVTATVTRPSVPHKQQLERVMPAETLSAATSGNFNPLTYRYEGVAITKVKNEPHLPAALSVPRNYDVAPNTNEISITKPSSSKTIFAPIKRESPLDLSVKTVKTKADSTGCDDNSPVSSISNSNITNKMREGISPNSLKVNYVPNFSKHTGIPEYGQQPSQNHPRNPSNYQNISHGSSIINQQLTDAPKKYYNMESVPLRKDSRQMAVVDKLSRAIDRPESLDRQQTKVPTMITNTMPEASASKKIESYVAGKSDLLITPRPDPSCNNRINSNPSSFFVEKRPSDEFVQQTHQTPAQQNSRSSINKSVKHEYHSQYNIQQNPKVTDHIIERDRHIPIKNSGHIPLSSSVQRYGNHLDYSIYSPNHDNQAPPHVRSGDHNKQLVPGKNTQLPANSLYPLYPAHPSHPPPPQPITYSAVVKECSFHGNYYKYSKSGSGQKSPSLAINSSNDSKSEKYLQSADRKRLPDQSSYETPPIKQLKMEQQPPKLEAYSHPNRHIFPGYYKNELYPENSKKLSPQNSFYNRYPPPAEQYPQSSTASIPSEQQIFSPNLRHPYEQRFMPEFEQRHSNHSELKHAQYYPPTQHTTKNNSSTSGSYSSYSGPQMLQIQQQSGPHSHNYKMESSGSHQPHRSLSYQNDQQQYPHQYIESSDSKNLLTSGSNTEPSNTIIARQWYPGPSQINQSSSSNVYFQPQMHHSRSEGAIIKSEQFAATSRVTHPENQNQASEFSKTIVNGSKMGADQNVISKLRNSLEMKEIEKQKLLRKQTSTEMSDEENNKSDIASLLAARIRTKGELKGYTPIPVTADVKREEPAAQTSDLPTRSIDPPSDLEGTSAFDLMDWGSACNDFVEQLQTGKKKLKRRRNTRKSELMTDINLEIKQENTQPVNVIPPESIVPQEDIVKAERLNGKEKQLTTAGSSSSDEDNKPLLLLRQQSIAEDKSKSSANKSENEKGSQKSKNSSDEEKNLARQELQESDQSISVKNKRVSMFEKLSEKIAKNMKEKQRLRLAARLGLSSSSDSDDDKKKLNIKRTKKILKKPNVRTNFRSSSNDSSGEEEEQLSLEKQKNRLLIGQSKSMDTSKRKKIEKSSSDSEPIKTRRKKTKRLLHPLSDKDENEKSSETESSENDSIKNCGKVSIRSPTKTRNRKKIKSRSSSSSEAETEKKKKFKSSPISKRPVGRPPSNKNKIAVASKSDKFSMSSSSDKEAVSQDNDEEENTEVMSKTTKPKNSVAAKSSDGDKEKSAKDSPPCRTVSTRRTKFDVGPKSQLVVEEETMTRSKKRKELEQKLANSKVLRNDKIIQNIFVNKKIGKDDKNTKMTATKYTTKNSEAVSIKNCLKSSKDKSISPTTKSSLKVDESKRKILDSDSDGIKSALKSKKKVRRVSKLEVSSSAEEESENDVDNVNERLRPRKNKLDSSSPRKEQKEYNKSQPLKSDKGNEGTDKRNFSKDIPAGSNTQSNAMNKISHVNQECKYPPGWEEQLYEYKRSLKIPPSLITIGRPAWHRISTSLPDLDPHSASDASENFHDSSNRGSKKFVRKSSGLASTENSVNENKSKIDKIKDHQKHIVQEKEEENSGDKNKSKSIIDLLHQRVIRPIRPNKRVRNVKSNSNESPKISHQHNSQLLPTPGVESKEAIFGVDNQQDKLFSPIILKSRTRKEYRVMKNEERIREVFGGEDRPASAPPYGGCTERIKIENCNKDEQPQENLTFDQKYNQYIQKMNMIQIGDKIRKFRKNTQSAVTEFDSHKQIKVERLDDDSQSLAELNNYEEDTQYTELTMEFAIDRIKEETQDTLGDERDTPDLLSERDGMTPLSFKSVIKKIGKKGNRNSRRKGSSGFDYLRKKKKTNTVSTMDGQSIIQKRRSAAVNYLQEKDENDISKEVRGWVLNKGVGESVLHKASRLDYLDVIAYCLDRLDMHPDQKDNAGYTPLHEACSRGHLDIARLLLQYGAYHSETALSGIRPFHEAVENGHIEVVRLLLAYGADPLLATYSGQTPLSLAENDNMALFLKNHLYDVQNSGPDKSSWKFNGAWDIFDPDNCGFNIFANVPIGVNSSDDFNYSPIEKESIESKPGMPAIKQQDAMMIENIDDSQINAEKDKVKKCDSNSNIMTYETTQSVFKATLTNNVAESENSFDYSKLNRFKSVSANCTVVLNDISVKKLCKQSVTNTQDHQVIQRHERNQKDSDCEFIEFEESEGPLPPLYLLRDEGADKWVLLSDLCTLLKVKSKDTLLKQICPSSPPSAVNKELIRELKMKDFIEKAKCLQLLCAGEKINIRSSKVVLVKYNESVQTLLNVRTIIMRL